MNTDTEWPYYARTCFGPGNYAIRSERYRFIQYNDGSEEFYDHNKDPQEWYNAINNIEYADIIDRHRLQVPQRRYPILGQKSTGHESYEASEKNRNNN